MSEIETPDGQQDPPVSRAEFQQLLDGFQELQDGYQELREASTPAEREQAEDELDDVRSDLSATARRLGISPAKLRQAAEEAKRSEDKERLRPLLRELLDELLPAKEEPVEESAAEEKPKPERKPKEDTPPREDSTPTPPHWGDRLLRDLW